MKKLYLPVGLSLFLSMAGWPHAQNGDSEIIGIWEFQTITSTYFSDPQEIISNDQGVNNRETLTFRGDQSFSFRGIYDGIENAGIGIWEISESKLTINVNGEKTIGNYDLNGALLTLNIDEEETDDYYASNSILKYKKRIISPKSYKEKKHSKK